MLRRAVWSDQFYPAEPVLLRREVGKYLSVAPAHRIVAPIGCVVPHAGYQYSGPIAGAVYARMELPDRFIVLCPNHAGRGAPLAIMSQGAWQTPLGNAPIDSALAGRLQKHCHLLTEDSRAHQEEHSLEVQLPFLQQSKPGFQFVPIAMSVDSLEVLEMLGHALAKTIQEQKEPVLIVASSDMNHFDTDERTRPKDRLAIDRILALDPRGLYHTVRRERISMCGYGPATAMLTAALDLGAKQAELVRYGTSADSTGDTSRVVGYAGLVVW